MKIYIRNALMTSNKKATSLKVAFYSYYLVYKN